MGLCKPEAGFYGAISEVLGDAAPGDICFADDQEPNLVVPRTLGWTVMHVGDGIGEMLRRTG